MCCEDRASDGKPPVIPNTKKETKYERVHRAHISSTVSVMRQIILRLHLHVRVPVRDFEELSHPLHQRHPGVVPFFCHVPESPETLVPDHRLTVVLQVDE